ncbi:MAG: hypothetical protein GW878_02395 [Acidobacteria bacterium]|nr:hypothetical protein [Acidobacteriota bacterium]
MPRRSPSADLAAFARRLPMAVVAAVAIWFVARPLYNPVLASATQVVARFYEWPRAAQILVDGDHAILSRTDLHSESAVLRVSLTQINFNLVPFLALVFALPGWWRGRGVKRLFAALAVFFAAHCLGLLWDLKAFYALSLGPWSAANYGTVLRNLYAGLRYFFEIPVTFTLPLVLWVGSYWDRVLVLTGLQVEARR